jgi:replicative DNA helicase
MNMAQKFADNPEHRILFCSLEMKGYELALRMFCEMTGTSYLSYMQGGLINPEHDKAFTEYLKAINFEIAEYGYTFEEVLRAIKEHFDGKKPDVVFIDYIQLVDWEAFGDERIAISLYSRRLAELAKKENIAVVVVSQLRRLPPGVTHSRPPELSDLKGSGSLEQDAHKVLFVYRVYEDGQEVPNYFINLAKNRQGPAPIDKLVGYDGKCYRFFDPEDNPLVKKVTETFGGSYEQKGG